MRDLRMGLLCTAIVFFLFVIQVLASTNHGVFARTVSVRRYILCSPFPRRPSRVGRQVTASEP